MRKTLYFIIIIAVVLGIFYFVNKKEAVAPAVVPNSKDKSTIPASTGPTELCFAKFGTPDANGAYDRYTLRLILNGEKATGELNVLPAETDSKTGEVKGTIGPENKTTMQRTANLDWFTFAGGTSSEKVKIILGKNTASVEQGTTPLNLTELSCAKLTERVNVENYLNDNIADLSPVKPVLGGSWYVVYATVDLDKNTGTVVYEDGHVQEKKNFSYTTDEKGEVASLTIK